jgi:hypothetical protein
MSTNQSNQPWLGIFWLFQNTWRIRRSTNYKSCSKLHFLYAQIFWEFFSPPSYFSWRIQFWVFIFILEKIWQWAHLSVVVFPQPGPACRRPLATWHHASLWPASLMGLKPRACQAVALPHLAAGLHLCLSVHPRHLSTDRRAPLAVELQRWVRAPPKPAIYPIVAAPQSGRVHDAGVAQPVCRRSSHSSVPRIVDPKPSTAVAPSHHLWWGAGTVVAVYRSRDRRPREVVEPSPFPVPPRWPVRSLFVSLSMWGRILLHTVVPRQSHASSLPVQSPLALSSSARCAHRAWARWPLAVACLAHWTGMAMGHPRYTVSMGHVHFVHLGCQESTQLSFLFFNFPV